MTTLEVIDSTGAWKLGGTYEDESPANTQLRILNMVNVARQQVLRQYYLSTHILPQVCFQEFDINVQWTEQTGCLSFVADVPHVVTLMGAKTNGWDAVLPMCENALPLTEVRSKTQLREFRNHSIASKMRTSGWFVTTGSAMEGYLLPKVKSDGLIGRAILAEPQTVANFNIEKDQYPMPDDFLSDMKRLLEVEYAKRWAIVNSQVSNSKSTIDNGRN